MKTYLFAFVLIVLVLAVLVPWQSAGSHVYANDAYPAPGEIVPTEESYPAPELGPTREGPWGDGNIYFGPTQQPKAHHDEAQPTSTPEIRVSWIVRATWAFMELIR